MGNVLVDLQAFLNASPTSWHAVREISSRLALCEFSPLDEEVKWELTPGKKYFTTRGGALCAFVLPEKKPSQLLSFASHTDSPALKLKPRPVYKEKNMSLVGVEVYGAPLLSSWLNRDLEIAGRVVITHPGGQIEERLVHFDDVTLFIPQLAIHLDREVNEKGLLLNKQEHLAPLLGLGNAEESSPVAAIETLLRRYVPFQTLLSFELFLVPKEKAHFVGMEGEMLASYRLDNLASAHAAVTAFGKIAKPSDHTLQMALFWDHEEIGSDTQEGAASPFFSDCLTRIAHHLHLDAEESILLRTNSLCVSLDMAHALNPHYVKKYEPHHLPLLGKGVVLKYNANQKYASNALSAAVIAHACETLGLSCQSYVSRSDTPCGSTVGPIVAQAMGINTVDIGIPELSMHSIREVMACQDYLDLVRILTHLLQ
ncbi:MAG: M18 family aminopeptidase [Verrucomicrobia bacterium]|nr:M18 family aminopeptidase [Verrucomicrobiota bacterium]